MSKGGSQTVTSMPDAQTQAYVQQLRNYALGAAGLPGATTYSDPARADRLSAIQGRGGFWAPLAGRTLESMAIPGAPASGAPQLPPEILAAQEQYGQYANAGNLGLTALTGGANPFYDASRAQALDPIFARARQQALASVGDDATLAGAFGGSRHGVAEGEALAGIANQQTRLQYEDYLNSLQRAMAAANLGFGAMARAAFLPQQFYGGQLGLLNQALGPYGTTQTTQTSSDPFSQLLGTGLTIASLIPGPQQPVAAGASGLLNSGYTPPPVSQGYQIGGFNPWSQY